MTLPFSFSPYLPWLIPQATLERCDAHHKMVDSELGYRRPRDWPVLGRESGPRGRNARTINWLGDVATWQRGRWRASSACSQGLNKAGLALADPTANPTGIRQCGCPSNR